MRLSSLFALALLAGCSRELAVPTNAQLALSPAFASAAPRETLTLAASGGTGGYKFAFADGGKLSGADATIDRNSGAYQAGAQGSAQDIVQVADSSGAVAQARVTVSQKLFLSPSSAQIAPGGRVRFSATGGKPPYVFAIASGGETMTIDAQSGLFFAGTGGDQSAHVTVTDATGDARAQDNAFVQVSAAVKLFAPGKDALTPYGTLDLIATGGQPPYSFKLQAGSNSGGSVGIATGHYQAGPAGGGGVQDVVVVTDSFGQTDTVTLIPGPPLSARLDSADLHPGLAVHVVASGGKPPYAFAFDARGNHSNGQIDGITGEYTPGPNLGSQDTLVVTDSTPGTLAKVPVPGTAVGPQRWTGLRAPRRFTADLNGDTRADLVSVTPYPTDPTGMLETRITPANGAPIAAQYHYTGLYDAAAVDLNGDGHADLALLQAGAFRIVLANPDGTLGGGTQIAARGDNPNDSAVLAWGVESGKASFFFPDYSGAICSSATGFVRYSAATSSLSCALNFTFKTPPAGLLALAAVDLNLDGNLDLAWIDGSDSKNLHYSYGPAFSSTATLALGTGVSFSFAATSAEAQFAPFAHAGGSGIVLAAQITGKRVAMLIRAVAGGPPVATAVYDPNPAGPSLWGLLSLDAANTFLSFDHLSAAVQAFDVNLAKLTSPLPQASFAVDNLVAGDVDGDQAPDALTGNSTLGLVDVILGDGTGTFGRRPRLSGIPFPLAAADIDGDGVRDIVTIANGDSLQVVWRDGAQFAYGPAMPVTANGTQTLTLGKFAGGSNGNDPVIQQGDGTIVYAGSHLDGTFDPPQPFAQAPGGSTAYPVFLKLQAANFGDGPLTDLWGRVGTTITALLHDPAVPGVLAIGPSTPSKAGTCQISAPDLNGDGVTDFVMGCNNASNDTVVQYIVTTGSKGTLSFGSWTQLYTSPGPVSQTCTVGSNHIAIVVSGTEIVAVSYNGGVQPPKASPLGAWAASASVTHMTCQKLDGDNLTDIALTDSNDRVHVYIATAPDQFAEKLPALSLPGANIGALEQAAGGPCDLLIRPVGSSTDFTVLLNAGDATFP